jgi:hypothetical protein
MDELAAIQAFRPAPTHDERAATAARRALRHAIQRSGRQRWTRPRLVVGIAVLAAAGATAAAAAGLGDRLLDFVAGEPAPPPVQRQFDLQSRRKAVVPWLQQDPRSRAIASKAEGVLAIETSVGPVYLWVAPTAGGGECHLLDIQALPVRSAGASCNALPVRLDYVPRGGIRETRVGDRYLRLLHGRVATDVASVEVRFKNGESATIPTAKGFFLRELTGNEEPALLIARNENGGELGRHTMRSLRVGPGQIPKPVGPYRTVIEIETSWGYPMSLQVAPGADGTVCERTRYRGGGGMTCGTRRPAADELRVGQGLWNETEDGKPLLVLQGSVGSAIVRLELEYRDGGRTEVPVTEGYVLFELSLKREPKQLVGFDAGGSVVARRSFR